MVLLRLLVSFVVDGGMLLGSCEDDGETREKGEDCVGVFYAWVYVFLGLGVVFSC